MPDRTAPADKTALAAELSALLAEQVALKRFGLALAPDKLQRLKSLLLQLGWYRGSYQMARNRPKRYAEIGGLYETHNQLIQAIRANPDEAIPRLELADFMHEHGIPGAHVVRAHAQGMLDGTRTHHASPGRVQPDITGGERFDSSPVYSFESGGRRELGPGGSWEASGLHPLATYLQLFWFGTPRSKRGVVVGVNHRGPGATAISGGVTHSVHVSTPDELRAALSDFPPDQVGDVIRAHLPFTRRPTRPRAPRNVDQAAAAQHPRMARRRLRFAKAEIERHAAPHLVAEAPVSLQRRYARPHVPFSEVGSLYRNPAHRSGLNQIGRSLQVLVSSDKNPDVRNLAANALRNGGDALRVLQDKLADVGHNYAGIRFNELADWDRARSRFTSGGKTADWIAFKSPLLETDRHEAIKSLIDEVARAHQRRGLRSAPEHALSVIGTRLKAMGNNDLGDMIHEYIRRCFAGGFHRSLSGETSHNVQLGSGYQIIARPGEGRATSDPMVDEPITWVSIGKPMGKSGYSYQFTVPRQDQLKPEQLSRRKLRFAKAEKTRHPAHPLVEGFPIEHALRHLANDPDNSHTLRQTAFVALTGRKGDQVSPEGHPEALWALHDLLQEHENKDGTTGHPLAKAYNWMSAADKIVLDAKTRRALEEAAEDERRRHPNVSHTIPGNPKEYKWRWTPEHQAMRAGIHLDREGHAGETLESAKATYDRLRARVGQLDPNVTDKGFTESLRRHVWRAQHVWRREHGIPTGLDEARSIMPIANRDEAHEDDVATRYRRRLRRIRLNCDTVSQLPRPRRYAMTTEDDFHRMLDANPDDHHTRLVFADWLQERGDPRAEGYRALGMLKRRPDNYGRAENPAGQKFYTAPEAFDLFGEGINHPDSVLPADWFQALDTDHKTDQGNERYWRYFTGRRPTEDAAALAFAKLPPERQAEITQSAQKLSRHKYAAVNSTGDFLDALRRSRSSQMVALKKAAHLVATRMGFRPVKVMDALHDGPAGATPGVASAVYGNGSPEQVHALASWSGLTQNQPGVAVFHFRPAGNDLLHRMRVPGSGMELRQRLDRSGIRDRVLVPHRSGYDVLIPDEGGRLAPTVAAFARANKSELQTSRGFFKLLGGGDRADTRATFRDTIAGAERMKRAGGKKRYGMTTEEDFHKLLDQNPDDHQTRLVFADWLQERGDPRAEGYRALGMLGISPHFDSNYKEYGWTRQSNRYPVRDIGGSVSDSDTPVGDVHGLPHEWMVAMSGSGDHGPAWSVHRSRRGADDAAALAFAKLPPERQAEITQSAQKLSRRKRRVVKCR